MTQVYEAIYENGVFRPLTAPAPSLGEGQQVRIVIETAPPDAILRLAAKVYEGLSEEEIDEIERIAFDRSSFFTEPARK